MEGDGQVHTLCRFARRWRRHGDAVKRMGHTVAVDVDLLVGLLEVLASEDLRGWLSGVDEQTPGPAIWSPPSRPLSNGHVETTGAKTT